MKQDCDDDLHTQINAQARVNASTRIHNHRRLSKQHLQVNFDFDDRSFNIYVWLAFWDSTVRWQTGDTRSSSMGIVRSDFFIKSANMLGATCSCNGLDGL